jgi:polysaccharide deacetylase family protein (PEP-CTERM system associated)
MTRSENIDVKNCISLDVEGFVESNLQSFHIEDKYISKTKENYEIEKNVNFILELLDNFNVNGTFFFLGRIAIDIPHIIKETTKYGHEIACHSFDHKRIFDLTKKEFREKITYAKKTLEDVSGKGVYGFRAPDFSITKSSLWALDILKEVGFLYDSSIYPTGIHDVYGIRDAKSFIHKLPNDLIEFPLSTINLFGNRLPFCGGGYFRLYPLTITEFFIKKYNKRGHPCIFYIHPYEIGPIIPLIPRLSFYRRLRHYYMCKNGHMRIKKILSKFKFGTAIGILREGNFVL